MPRKSIFGFFPLFFILLFASGTLLAKPVSELAPLKPLSGKWVGRGNGENGPSVAKQTFSFILHQAHFMNRSTKRFKPEEGKETGQIRRSVGVFSFDPVKKKILYREFSSDGQVVCYQLEKISKDGATFTFLSETEKGQKASGKIRLVFQLAKRNSLQVTVATTSDNKTFKQVETIRLRRVSQKKEKRIHRKRKNKNIAADLE